MSLSQIESSVSSLEEQIKLTNKSYKDSTDLVGGGVDRLVGFLGGETVEDKYKQRINEIKNQAKIHEKILLEEIKNGVLTKEKQKIIHSLSQRIGRISTQHLEDVEIIAMTGNTDIKQIAANAIYGAKGEVIGITHGLKGIITSALELAVFMAKYTGSIVGIHPEYKEKIDEQGEKLFGWIKKEGAIGMKDKVLELLHDEIQRVSNLPPEQQAEAIGKIAGNVIAMLLVIKAQVNIIKKIGKTSRQVAIQKGIVEKGAREGVLRGERLAKTAILVDRAKRGSIALHGANIFLNGLAESMIGYTLAKSLSLTLACLKIESVSVGKKITEIDKTIAEMEVEISTEMDAGRRENIQSAITKLKSEKYQYEQKNIGKDRQKDIVLARSGASLQTVERNMQLSDTARILEAEKILKEAKLLDANKSLSSQEKELIIAGHNASSETPAFEQTFGSIRKKALASNGLPKTWKKKLMDYGIMGSLPATPVYPLSQFLIGHGKRNLQEMLRDRPIPLGQQIAFYTKNGSEYIFEGLPNKQARLISASNKNLSHHIGRCFILDATSDNGIQTTDFFTTTIRHLEIREAHIMGFADWRIDHVKNSRKFDPKTKKVIGFSDSEGNYTTLKDTEELFFGPVIPDNGKSLAYIRDQKNGIIRLADKNIADEIATRNIREIRKYGDIGIYFEKLYGFIGKDFPNVLDGLQVRGTPHDHLGVGSAGFLNFHGTSGIHVDMTNGLNTYKGMLSTHTEHAKIAFAKLGLRLSENEKAGFLAAHVFFHEMGHIYDYKKLTSTQGKNIHEAFDLMEKRGNQERKLLQATPKDQYFQTYRSLESEFNADDFANNMIRKYENEIRALVHTLR